MDIIRIHFHAYYVLGENALKYAHSVKKKYKRKLIGGEMSNVLEWKKL